MKPYRLALSLAVLLSTSLLISDAYAQFGGGWGGSGRSGRGSRSTGSAENRDGRADRQMMPDTLSYEQVEYRLTQFQLDLKLTTEQNNEWQAFANKVRAYAGDQARERARNMTAPAANATPATALQHIGQAVDAARNRLTALEDIESAAKALYQKFTPEQKVLADLRIPIIVAPRPMGTNGNGVGNKLPDPGSSPASPR